MSKLNKLILNHKDGTSEFDVQDANAVAYDEAQNKTEDQQKQARENIGADNILRVYYDPNEPEAGASKTATEILNHVQAGGTAVLVIGTQDGVERCYALSHCDQDYATFSTMADEPFYDIVMIDVDGKMEFYTHELATIGSVKSSIEQSRKWKLLDTFDLSSGATDNEVDTTGCTELMAITKSAITGSGQTLAWKGVAMTASFMLAKGSILRMEYLSNGTIAWQSARSNTDTLLKTGFATGAVADDNLFGFYFDTVSAGTVEVWGR